MSELLELAARCEAAVGPSKTLDVAIADALGLKTLNGMGRAVYLHNSPKGSFAPPRYSASLDAAMTLIEQGELCVRFGWNTNPDAKLLSGAVAAILYADFSGTVAEGEGKTPPLAICAAALRARASTTPENSRG